MPKPLKVVLYGPEGIGKSTFAAAFPKPIFIDTEDSTGTMAVDRLQKPSSWTMLMEQVRYIRDHGQALGYRTLVIDTLDWAERLCMDHLMTINKWGSIEDPGYGKGYTVLGEEWGRFLNLLTEVSNGGMTVVCTAHAMMRKFEQPDEMGAYDRWELKLQKKCSPLVKEWSDLLLFANYKTTVLTDSKTKKSKAYGGERVMYTSHHPAWDAKNRITGMPEELPLDYQAIAAVIEGVPAEPKPTVEQAAPPAAMPPEPEPPAAVPDAIPEPEADPERAAIQSEGLPGPDPELAKLPASLRDLMQLGGYNLQTLLLAVGPKSSGGMGYWPAGTAVEAIPADFWAYVASDWARFQPVMDALALPFDLK